MKGAVLKMGAKEKLLEVLLHIIDHEPITRRELLKAFKEQSERTIDRNVRMLDVKNLILIEKKIHKDDPTIRINWERFNFFKEEK
jgi:SOS-response transcriptional repressor LexA